MCGIIGMQGIDADTDALLDLLSHRGPDACGEFTANDTTLLHTRLSIIDLNDRANMPLFDEEERYALISNQEIYNHDRLRSSLAAQGHEFTTASDTEVIVHLYEEHGRDAVKKLQGMFAFAIYDRETTELFLARDRFGIKPLYYAYDRKTEEFAFASERKVLRSLGFDADTVTALPRGHTLRLTTDGITVQEYYPEQEQTQKYTDKDDVRGQTRDLLEESVEERCMADVPVGTFLSGGLDSSIVTALAADRFDDLSTFSIGLGDSDDLPYAKRVADALDLQHHVRMLSADEALDALPSVLYHLESTTPFVARNAVVTYHLAEYAAEQVKVVLTGSGADELFGGYDTLISDGQLQPEQVRKHVFTDLPKQNLQRVDTMTMAHALEARVPFLDTQLVEYALGIAPDLKVRNGTRKQVLRAACDDLLPDDVVHRPKLSFQRGTGVHGLLKDAYNSDDHGSRQQFYQQLYDTMMNALDDGRDAAIRRVTDEIQQAYTV